MKNDLIGKPHNGELPIVVQENPIPTTGYFVNGGHRTAPLPPWGKKGAAGKGAAGKGAAGKKGYKKNPDDTRRRLVADHAKNWAGLMQRLRKMEEEGKAMPKPSDAELDGLITKPLPASVAKEIAPDLTEKVLPKKELVNLGLRPTDLSLRVGLKLLDSKTPPRNDDAWTLMANATRYKYGQLGLPAPSLQKLYELLGYPPSQKKSMEAKKVKECEEIFQKKGTISKPPGGIKNFGKSTGLKDKNGLVLDIGAIVRKDGDTDHAHNHAVVVGVAYARGQKKDEAPKLIRVEYRNSDGTPKQAFNTHPHKYLRQSPPMIATVANEGGSMIGAVAAQSGTFVGSYAVSGALHAVLRLATDRFAPEVTKNNERMVDTAVGIVSISSAMGLSLLLPENLRAASFAAQLIRLVALGGRQVSAKANPIWGQIAGGGQLGESLGAYVDDAYYHDVGAAPQVQYDTWRPRGLTGHQQQKNRLLTSNSQVRAAIGL